ncbi:hypothetical protein SASPL_118190 [Salvia splendens]|uniref:Uncharacterized protein n=1 Tax=Salvia splendens TaxID=180675 RepID=A0A8X8ZYH2_SALSN|nr:hypothetical protein SASPL_118190 [Salvia splendens]
MAYGYVHMVLYYLGNYGSDIIQHLKESLSQTLVTIYPLVGIIRDALSADCNDQGLPFSVAKVKVRMSDFLQNPNVELMNKLFPRAKKMQGSGDSIILIQLSCFDCGSIAMHIQFHHLIADMVSVSTFLQRWASNAQGLGYDFDASALSILKAQTSSFSVSQLNVVTAVIWQSFMEAVTEESAGKDVKLVLIGQAVNLRRKATPPFPDDSFGNIAWSTKSLWINPKEKELTELLREVKKGIAKIDGEFVSRLRSDGVYDFLEELWNEMPQEATSLGFTSWTKIGLSEVDFGWGKPVWMSTCILQSFEPVKEGNNVNLLDSKSGGIEAWTIHDEKYVA